MTDLTERKLHGVAIYNPDLLSRDELIAQFAARTELLDEILVDLRKPKIRQHRILVGTRGMGKTTLLRRIGFAVERDAELSATWMPVTFPEEQYNVARLSDFYVNVLDALGDALEQAGQREQAASIDDAVAELPLVDSARTEMALEVLVQVAERLDRRLILLVDNLDLVIQRLDTSEQWNLRELLSHEARILLIGAMPTIIGATYKHKAPFLDFFKIHELKGLTREETRNVLLTLSRQQQVPAVEELLATDPARIDTLHTLTGGNPRTIALLFAVLAQGTEGDVRTDLEKLLDQSTPLYKARFEALPPQAQQVVDAVAIHWAPISAGELTEKLPLEVNQVSAQLNRLVQQGILEKVEYHPPTKTGFQVAERFFNIWYLMRASRRVRRRLLWLVQFLRLFYGAEQLTSKARDLLRETGQSTHGDRLRHVEFCLAVAEVIGHDSTTRYALESHAIRTLLSDVSLSGQLETMLDLEGADASLKPVVDREKWLTEFHAAVQALPLGAKEKEDIGELVGSLFGATRAEKLALIRGLPKRKASERRRLLKGFSTIRELWLQFYGPQFGHLVLNASRQGLIDNPDDDDGIRAAGITYSRPEIVGLILMRQPDKFADLERLARSADDPFLLAVCADILIGRNQLQEAQDLINQIPPDRRFGSVYIIDGNLSVAMGNLEKAADQYETAATTAINVFVRWRYLARALFEAGRVDESFEIFERALHLKRDSDTLADYGFALRAMGLLERAEPVLREALSAEPAHEGALVELFSVLIQQQRAGEALKLADAIPPNASEAVRLSQAKAYIIGGRSGDANEILLELLGNNQFPKYLTVRLLTSVFGAGMNEHGISLLRRVLAEWPDDPSAMATMPLIHAVGVGIHSGAGKQILEVLESLDLVDRLRALYEAVRIATTDDRGSLKRLAPEVQQPVQMILDEWTVRPNTVVRPSNKTRAKRKKR